LKRTIFFFLLSASLGLAGIYAVSGSELFNAAHYRLTDPDAAVVALCLLAFSGLWLGPAVKLTMLCRYQRLPSSLAVTLPVHLVLVLGAAITPGGAGGAPVMAAAFKLLGVPWGRSIGLAVQGFILDLVLFAWLVPVSVIYLTLSHALRLPPSIQALALLSTFLAAAVALILGRFPRIALRLMLWLGNRKLLARFKRRLSFVARDYYRSTRTFMNMPLTLWLGLQLVSMLAWVCSPLLYWGLLHLYGLAADVLTITAMLSLVTLISYIIPTPGAAGFMELAVGLGSSLQGMGGELSAPLLVWRLASYNLIYLVGPLAGWWLYAFSRSKTAAKA
jgi:uncharacterized protein (TIRG00374 family)